MPSPVVPPVDPQDTASVRAALESLARHCYLVAERYARTREAMIPKIEGSLQVVGDVGARDRAARLGAAMAEVEAALTEAASKANAAHTKLNIVREIHDQHVQEGSQNG